MSESIITCGCPTCQQIKSEQCEALECSHTRFYIVMRDKPGGTFVSKYHRSFIGAEEEAKRLCIKEGGKYGFYVLAAIIKVEAGEIPIKSTPLTQPIP